MLDPGSYNWDPLDDEMKERLDSKKFVSLSLEQAGKTRGCPIYVVSDFLHLKNHKSLPVHLPVRLGAWHGPKVAFLSNPNH
jgi:hypothetical protein